MTEFSKPSVKITAKVLGFGTETWVMGTGIGELESTKNHGHTTGGDETPMGAAPEIHRHHLQTQDHRIHSDGGRLKTKQLSLGHPFQPPSLSFFTTNTYSQST